MTEVSVGSLESLRMTRSLTIFHALLRIFGTGNIPSCLVLHVLGADHSEGTTPEETRSVFADLLQLVGQDEHVRDIDLTICGPNIDSRLHGTLHSFLHHHAPARKPQNNGIIQHDEGRQSATYPGTRATSYCDTSPSAKGAGATLAVKLRYNSGLYHDVSGLFPTPHAMFLFNAGLWGYDDWVPTLEHILGCRYSLRGGDDDYDEPPVVITSYCQEEAADDTETIQEVLSGKRESSLTPAANADILENVLDDKLEWLWKSEVNPHRSLVPRRTECGVVGRALFENHSWQALRRLQSDRSCVLKQT